MRLALGISYLGAAYQGWQSQPSGQTVQDRPEAALAAFATTPIATLCAARTRCCTRSRSRLHRAKFSVWSVHPVPENR